MITLTLLLIILIVAENLKQNTKEIKENLEKHKLLLAFKRLELEQTNSNIKLITLTNKKKERETNMELNIQLFAKNNIVLEKLKETVEKNFNKKVTEQIEILTPQQIAEKHELPLNAELVDYLTELFQIDGTKQTYLELLTVDNFILRTNNYKTVKKNNTRKPTEKVPTEKDDLLLTQKVNVEFNKDITEDLPNVILTGADYENLLEAFKFATTQKENWSCGKVEIYNGKITSTDTYALLQQNISVNTDVKYYLTTEIFNLIKGDLRKFSNKTITIFKINEDEFIVNWNNRSVTYKLSTSQFINYPPLLESINNFGETLEFDKNLKETVELIKVENKPYKENSVIIDLENKTIRGYSKDKKYKIDCIATKNIEVGMNQEYLLYALNVNKICNYKNSNSMFIFKNDEKTFIFAPKMVKD